PLQLDLGAVAYARRDLDAIALRPPLPAGAVTRRARRLDDRAHPAAVRARLLQRKESLRGRDHPGAVALRAALRCGSRCGARAVTGVAGKLERDRHRRLQALERVLERDTNLDLDVRAALPALRLLAASAAAPEETAEDVAEIEVAEIE